MGTGLAAAIPIIIGPFKEAWPTTIDPNNFSENFFENYDFDEKKGLYTIKTDLLIKNYHDFITEFYTCIGEKDSIENLPIARTYDEFETVFKRDARYGKASYLETTSYFSCLGGECYKYWLFYSGSYKAYLEVYVSLWHFENLLPKAIKNPLANSVKFGIYG
jgi:hypothetical protein